MNGPEITAADQVHNRVGLQGVNLASNTYITGPPCFNNLYRNIWVLTHLLNILASSFRKRYIDSSIPT